MIRSHVDGRGLFIFLLLCFFLLPLITKANTEDEVRTFFEDIPVMINIASCESKFRQFDEEGIPLRGGWGNAMVGVFQFYEAIHRGTAASLGFDLATLQGNLQYAKHLYTTSGTAPWASSKSCWGKMSVEAAKHEKETDIEELQEKIVTLKKLVAQLERLLALKKAV